MRAKVQRWGNSLAVRIPKPFATEVGLKADSDIEVSVRHGQLVVVPAHRAYSLAELVGGITPRNRHAEVDLGRPQGRELL